MGFLSGGEDHYLLRIQATTKAKIYKARCFLHFLELKHLGLYILKYTATYKWTLSETWVEKKLICNLPN